MQRGEGTEGEKNANAKKKWFEEKQKRKHAELERLGLDTTETHRIESAEQVCYWSVGCVGFWVCMYAVASKVLSASTCAV